VINCSGLTIDLFQGFQYLLIPGHRNHDIPKGLHTKPLTLERISHLATGRSQDTGNDAFQMVTWAQKIAMDDLFPLKVVVFIEDIVRKLFRQQYASRFPI
jgi:hypothetical protein